MFSESLELHFKTESTGFPTAFTDMEITTRETTGTQDVIFQFAPKCSDGYHLSFCHYPYGCEKNEYTTYTIFDEEKANERGYYEQLVKHFLPCSIFKWEISSFPDNFTLYEEYLSTSIGNHEKILTEELEEIISVNGQILLKWTLTQPCIDEYHIEICSKDYFTNKCWNGIFDRPTIESRNDFKITIDLTSLDGFDLILEPCHQYEIKLKPQIDGIQHASESIKHFTLIEELLPPDSMNIQNVTDRGAVVHWQPSKCTNAREVLVVVSMDEHLLYEYQPQAFERKYQITDLNSCSEYQVEVFSVEGGVKSEKAQIMSLITQHESNINVSLETYTSSIHLEFGLNASKCLQVHFKTDIEYQIIK